MKRPIASALAILSCLLIFAVIIYADPGDTPTPQPPDSNLVIPPPGFFETSSNDTVECDTCPESPDPPWIDPNQ